MTLRTKLPAAAVALSLGLLGGTAAAAPAFIVQADIVRGGEGQPHGPVCVPNTVFVPGEQMVVRAEVLDPATGQPIGASAINSRWVHVTAKVGDQTITLHYEAHPPNAPKQEEYWAGGWTIPAGFAAGKYDWSVTADDAQGETATFKPIGSDVGLGVVSVMPAGGAPMGAPPAGK